MILMVNPFLLKKLPVNLICFFFINTSNIMQLINYSTTIEYLPNASSTLWKQITSTFFPTYLF